jgi:hypothetical protein
MVEHRIDGKHPRKPAARAIGIPERRSKSSRHGRQRAS